jgi:hypothetical protein
VLFMCLPACSNGDVAWEAQASSACLAQAGLKWDQQTQAIIRDDSSSSGTQEQDSTSAGAADSMGAAAVAAAPASAPAPAAPAAEAAPAGSDDNSSASEAKRTNRSATPADAPAGEEQDAAAAAAPAAANSVATLAAAAALAQAVASTAPAASSTSTTNGLRGIIPATADGNSSGSSSNGGRHVKISTAQPTTVTYDATSADSGSSSSSAQPVCDAKALLLQLFADFPTACLDMIQTTEASTILEGPVLTRAARQMPACMGRGSVVVLGEAAHPVRPSGEC